MFSKTIGSEKCWVQESFGSEKNLGPNKVWVQKSWVQKNLGPKNVGSTKFWVNKNSGPKTNLKPTEFFIQKYLGEKEF